jgi:predicted RNase H-like HicB family nuclease
MAFPAIIHPDGGRFWVEFPDLKGCFSDGDTLDDAASNAREALGAYLRSLLERRIPIPAASDIEDLDAGDDASVACLRLIACTLPLP